MKDRCLEAECVCDRQGRHSDGGKTPDSKGTLLSINTVTGAGPVRTGSTGTTAAGRGFQL